MAARYIMPKDFKQDTNINLASIVKRIASVWLDPETGLQELASTIAAPEFGLAPANFNLGLTWIFQLWLELDLASPEVQPPWSQYERPVQILAGNTPAMIAQGLLQALILGKMQYLKIPRLCSSFAQLLWSSINNIAPQLANNINMATWHGKLVDLTRLINNADLVLAYGDDNTIHTIEAQLAPSAIYRGHGHRFSTVIIAEDSTPLHTLTKLAQDFLIYDQRGCLSPRLVLVKTGQSLSPAGYAELFASMVSLSAQALPRGNLLPGEALSIQEHRSIYGCAGPMYCGDDWTISYAEQFIKMPAAPRCIVFVPFNSYPQLIAILNSWHPNLLSIGIDYLDAGLKQVIDQRAIIVSPIGKMQRRLLLW